MQKKRPVFDEWSFGGRVSLRESSLSVWNHCVKFTVMSHAHIAPWRRSSDGSLTALAALLIAAISNVGMQRFSRGFSHGCARHIKKDKEHLVLSHMRFNMEKIKICGKSYLCSENCHKQKEFLRNQQQLYTDNVTQSVTFELLNY